jgi:hypothetical protein
MGGNTDTRIAYALDLQGQHKPEGTTARMLHSATDHCTSSTRHQKYTLDHAGGT